jgi:hypothetical protein
MKEAGEATRILGIPWDHLLFLGYPDRGLYALWTTNWEKTYRSPYTKMDHPSIAIASIPRLTTRAGSARRSVQDLGDLSAHNHLLPPSRGCSP